MYFDNLTTPIGNLVIYATNKGVSAVLFNEEKQNPMPNSHTNACKAQLIEYFKGERKTFSLALDASGTAFQKQVWQALTGIAFGEAKSYGDIAIQLNNPKAVRAVGAANGKNPISIIVPCHRVIGANRSLTGYAGGLERKKWLLQHEGIDFRD